jgi:hypothetical protein
MLYIKHEIQNCHFKNLKTFLANEPNENLTFNFIRLLKIEGKKLIYFV